MSREVVIAKNDLILYDGQKGKCIFAWNSWKNGRGMILIVDEHVLMSQLAIEKSLNISFFPSPN